MATYSSVLAWRIPGTREPGGLPSMGLQSQTRLKRLSSSSSSSRTWKQPRCSLTDEWIQKLWYIYTMEYYSVIKKKKKDTFKSVLMTWMNLEPITQSEV